MAAGSGRRGGGGGGGGSGGSGASRRALTGTLGVVALAAGCVVGASRGPGVEFVGPAEPAMEAEAASASDGAGATDLGTALAALDTLFVPTVEADPSERTVLEAVRLVRRGELGPAADALGAMAPDGAALERGMAIRGQLLLHELRWHELRELVGGTGTGATLADTYLAAGAEEVEYLADRVDVPLFRTTVGTPAIDVDLGGVVRRFWIDTGAGLTVLTASLAAELGLDDAPADGIAAGTATSRQVGARPVAVPEIRVGDVLRVRNHPAMILRDEDLQLRVAGRQLFRIDGILGWNFIRHLDLTLDHGTGVAVIRRPVARDRGPRNLLWLGYPLVVGRGGNGRELLFGLDTGAAATALAPPFLEATGTEPTGSSTRRVGGAGGFERVEVQTVDTADVVVGGQRLRLTRIDVQPGSPAPLARIHGVLGSDLAAGAAMRIDWLNGRFELEPAP